MARLHWASPRLQQRQPPSLLLATLLLLCLAWPSALPSDAALSDAERLFLSEGPSAEGAREALRYYTSTAHMAATEADYDTALYTQRKMQEYGLQAEIQSFRALINFPVSRSLQMTAPVQFTPTLSEDVYASDSTSDTPWRNQSFHGYGASGDVTGELVYANYASASDFDTLAAAGVDVRGKIVIARYGEVFRGLKVQNAQQAGATACLIYSDPAEDGARRGAVYDQGPWRPDSSVQRGSVQFLSRCSGDPAFTERDPGVCGYENADLIPSIPSLPLSARDALPLLQQLRGAPAPPGWVGGFEPAELPSYVLGSGPTTVRLIVNMSYDTRTLWNVVATIPGSHPDRDVAQQVVVAGNHRDAWVFGAADPSSGSAALLELARGLGVLLSSGWRPDRSIVLASWDGEEYGLLGSVHWGEKHAAMLSARAVAYLNIDEAVTGDEFYAAASPSLAALLRDAAADVPSPTPITPGESLLSTWAAQSGSGSSTPPVSVLGSGSDYAVFLHHLGIPSADMGFRGAYGVYHSTMDSFAWMERFGDASFVKHQAAAQVLGLLAMRLACAEVLPLRVDHTAAALIDYQKQVRFAATQAGLDESQVEWRALNDAVAAFQPPALALEKYRSGMLVGSASQGKDKAKGKGKVPSAPTSASLPRSPRELAQLNRNLVRFERSFLIRSDDVGFVGGGLEGRRWFRHVLQAPGLETGYAARVFPSIDDVISRARHGGTNGTAAGPGAAGADANVVEKMQRQVDLLAAKLARVARIVSSMLPDASGCQGLAGRDCLTMRNASACAWFVPFPPEATGAESSDAAEEARCLAGFDPCAQSLLSGWPVPDTAGVFLPNAFNLCGGSNNDAASASASAGRATSDSEEGGVSLSGAALGLRITFVVLLGAAGVAWCCDGGGGSSSSGGSSSGASRSEDSSATLLPASMHAGGLWLAALILLLGAALELCINESDSRGSPGALGTEVLLLLAVVAALVQTQASLDRSKLGLLVRRGRGGAVTVALCWAALLVFLGAAIAVGVLAREVGARTRALAATLLCLAALSLALREMAPRIRHALRSHMRSRTGSSASANTAIVPSSSSSSSSAGAVVLSSPVNGPRRPDGHQLLEQHADDDTEAQRQHPQQSRHPGASIGPASPDLENVDLHVPSAVGDPDGDTDAEAGVGTPIESEQTRRVRTALRWGDACAVTLLLILASRCFAASDPSTTHIAPADADPNAAANYAAQFSGLFVWSWLQDLHSSALALPAFTLTVPLGDVERAGAVVAFVALVRTLLLEAFVQPWMDSIRLGRLGVCHA